MSTSPKTDTMQFALGRYSNTRMAIDEACEFARNLELSIAAEQAKTRALEERVAVFCESETLDRLGLIETAAVARRDLRETKAQLAAVQKERDKANDYSRDFDHLKANLVNVVRERDTAQQALRESEAGAAVLREALEAAKHALDVCYSDSHAIRPDWLRDQGGPVVAQAVENIRKWSGSRRGTIMSALATAAGASLLADVERLTADRDRLDWAEANKERLFCIGWDDRDKWKISENASMSSAYDGPMIIAEAPTLREAIDSARKPTASE